MRIAMINLVLAAMVCAGMITTTPALAMQGVDNLTVFQCSPNHKAILENAFKAANLLMHQTQTAMRQVYNIGKQQPSAEREQNLRRTLVDKYTGVEMDARSNFEWYTTVFGPFDPRRWDVVRRRYSAVVPLPLAVGAVCETEEPRYCRLGAGAYVRRVARQGTEATISICPQFFRTTLAEAQLDPLYRSVWQLELYWAGVIVHELMHTHFLDTTSAHDNGYGLARVLKLSPEIAENSADSYHVFAILTHRSGEVPKCVRKPSRWRNC